MRDIVSLLDSTPTIFELMCALFFFGGTYLGEAFTSQSHSTNCRSSNAELALLWIESWPGARMPDFVLLGLGFRLRFLLFF